MEKLKYWGLRVMIGMLPVWVLFALVLFFSPDDQNYNYSWLSWSNNIETTRSSITVTGPLVHKGKEYPFASAKIALDFKVNPGEYFCVEFDVNSGTELQLLVYYERTMFAMMFMHGSGPFCYEIPKILTRADGGGYYDPAPYSLHRAHLIIPVSSEGLTITPRFYISQENEDVRDQYR